MPKSKSYSIRVPDSMEWIINAVQRKQHYDSYTSVFLLGLELCKDLFSLTKNASFIEADKLSFKDLTPEEKYLKRLEHDKAFKEQEYRLAAELSSEQLKEYEKDWKSRGLSILKYLEDKKLFKEHDLWNIIHIFYLMEQLLKLEIQQIHILLKKEFLYKGDFIKLLRDKTWTSDKMYDIYMYDNHYNKYDQTK